MTISPLPFYAERFDPPRNMARFYALEVSEDLFGAIWLERRWGRIGSRGHIKVELVDGDQKLVKRIEALSRQKTRRGYCRPAHSDDPVITLALGNAESWLGLRKELVESVRANPAAPVGFTR